MAKYRTIIEVDLKAIREMHGISQRQLAIKANVDISRMNGFERGREIMSEKVWERISKILDIKKLEQKVRDFDK